MKNTETTQRQYRHKASFGKQQEYIAIAELLKRRYDVYIPLVDDQGIDCVIRRGEHDYVDLQIKARSNDCQPTDAGRFTMKIPKPREKYFFLFYSAQAETYWLFPSIELVAQASKNKKGESAGEYSINLTGRKKGKVYARPQYSQYENNFELLMT